MMRAVVFDLGQVLSSPANLFTEPAALLGVDPAEFEAAYWTDRRAYDRGGSELEYWGPILTKLGKPAALETAQQLAALDARLWIQLRPTAEQLLREVHGTGILTAVLSNAPTAVDIALLDAPYLEDADYWFVSASMMVTKPDPAAYYRVTEVLDVEPNEVAFIDDRPANVDAARKFGWNAHLFVDDADTRRWLEQIGVLEAAER